MDTLTRHDNLPAAVRERRSIDRAMTKKARQEELRKRFEAAQARRFGETVRERQNREQLALEYSPTKSNVEDSFERCQRLGSEVGQAMRRSRRCLYNALAAIYQHWILISSLGYHVENLRESLGSQAACNKRAHPMLILHKSMINVDRRTKPSRDAENKRSSRDVRALQYALHCGIRPENLVDFFKGRGQGLDDCAKKYACLKRKSAPTKSDSYKLTDKDYFSTDEEVSLVEPDTPTVTFLPAAADKFLALCRDGARDLVARIRVDEAGTATIYGIRLPKNK